MWKIFLIYKVYMSTVSKEELQNLAKKYTLTVSGSKKEIAKRIWTLRAHLLTKKELKLIEDYLELSLSKRYAVLIKK
jgi:SAP domain-containing new25